MIFWLMIRSCRLAAIFGAFTSLAALRQVAAETGATPNQVVLAWMLQSAPRILPLFGASTVAQLQESLGALDLTLSPEQMAALDGAGA